MKKQYMKPATAICFVATSKIVCVSGPGVSGTTNDVNDLLSRRSSVWDDEDED